VQRYCPYDDRFSAENFGFQPTWLILQALEQGAKFTSEHLHLQELGIATLTACFINANRDPKKGEPAKPTDFFYFADRDSTGPKLNGAACDAFFSLVSEQLLPSWVLDIAPIELIRSQRANRSIVKPRAWIGENLLLLLPRVEVDSDGKHTVTAALAFCNNATGLVELTDPDSGTEFFLHLPNPQISWSIDAEFERLSDDGSW
jgi:hypothetical protein